MLWPSLHIHLCNTEAIALYLVGLYLCHLAVNSYNEEIRAHCDATRCGVDDPC